MTPEQRQKRQELQYRIRNVGLSIIGAIVSAIAIGVWKFYNEWKIDEKTEEAQMFDTAEQKVKVIMHTENAMNKAELVQNRILDSLLVDKILHKLDDVEQTVKHADSMAELNAVQVFQIKEEIKNDEN